MENMLTWLTNPGLALTNRRKRKALQREYTRLSDAVLQMVTYMPQRLNRPQFFGDEYSLLSQARDAADSASSKLSNARQALRLGQTETAQACLVSTAQEFTRFEQRLADARRERAGVIDFLRSHGYNVPLYGEVTFNHPLIVRKTTQCQKAPTRAKLVAIDGGSDTESPTRRSRPVLTVILGGKA